MARPAGRLVGYTELLVKFRTLPAAQQRALRGRFRDIGRLVAQAGRRRFTGGVSSSRSVQKTADGFTPVVRLRGVEVDQRYRKTTGLRPDWGARQMREGLVPGLADEAERAVELVDLAMEEAQREVGLS